MRLDEKFTQWVEVESQIGGGISGTKPGVWDGLEFGHGCPVVQPECVSA